MGILNWLNYGDDRTCGEYLIQLQYDGWYFNYIESYNTHRFNEFVIKGSLNISSINNLHTIFRWLTFGNRRKGTSQGLTPIYNSNYIKYEIVFNDHLFLDKLKGVALIEDSVKLSGNYSFSYSNAIPINDYMTSIFDWLNSGGNKFLAYRQYALENLIYARPDFEPSLLHLANGECRYNMGYTSVRENHIDNLIEIFEWLTWGSWKYNSRYNYFMRAEVYVKEFSCGNYHAFINKVSHENSNGSLYDTFLDENDIMITFEWLNWGTAFNHLDYKPLSYNETKEFYEYCTSYNDHIFFNEFSENTKGIFNLISKTEENFLIRIFDWMSWGYNIAPVNYIYRCCYWNQQSKNNSSLRVYQHISYDIFSDARVHELIEIFDWLTWGNNPFPIKSLYRKNARIQIPINHSTFDIYPHNPYDEEIYYDPQYGYEDVMYDLISIFRWLTWGRNLTRHSNYYQTPNHLIDHSTFNTDYPSFGEMLYDPAYMNDKLNEHLITIFDWFTFGDNMFPLTRFTTSVNNYPMLNYIGWYNEHDVYFDDYTLKEEFLYNKRDTADLAEIFEWLNLGSNRCPIKQEDYGNYRAPKPTVRYSPLSHLYKNQVNTSFRNGNNDLTPFTVLIQIFNWYRFGISNVSLIQVPTGTLVYQNEDYIEDYNDHLYLDRLTNDFRIMGDDICPNKEFIISIFDWLTWGNSELTFIIKTGTIESYYHGLHRSYSSGKYNIEEYDHDPFGDGSIHGNGHGSCNYEWWLTSDKVNYIIPIFEWLNFGCDETPDIKRAAFREEYDTVMPEWCVSIIIDSNIVNYSDQLYEPSEWENPIIELMGIFYWLNFGNRGFYIGGA